MTAFHLVDKTYQWNLNFDKKYRSQFTDIADFIKFRENKLKKLSKTLGRKRGMV